MTTNNFSLRKMRNAISTVAFVLAVTVIANAENSVVLNQRAAPLKIIKYKATYEEEYRGSYSSHPDQIRHAVSCENVSGKAVAAYQIGLVAFDAFNNLMDKFNGWSIRTIAISGSADDVWTQSPYAAFSFQGYGTGVAYVNAVRFEDGSIWRADLAEALLELQKFEKDLKKEDLQEKKRP